MLQSHIHEHNDGSQTPKGEKNPWKEWSLSPKMKKTPLRIQSRQTTHMIQAKSNAHFYHQLIHNKRLRVVGDSNFEGNLRFAPMTLSGGGGARNTRIVSMSAAYVSFLLNAQCDIRK